MAEVDRQVNLLVLRDLRHVRVVDALQRAEQLRLLPRVRVFLF